MEILSPVVSGSIGRTSHDKVDDRVALVKWYICRVVRAVDIERQSLIVKTARKHLWVVYCIIW